MKNSQSFRIGHGYDAHRLVKGRVLVLGGVTIPHTYGLAGHSDADVLIHSIIDALLGAAGMGDIGQHFPDTDSKYKDMDSLKFLEQVSKKLMDARYKVGNVDATIIAEAPKLASHISEMRSKIALVLEVDEGEINIKATTTEGMGFTGTEEGIAVHAVALIVSI